MTDATLPLMLTAFLVGLVAGLVLAGHSAKQKAPQPKREEPDEDAAEYWWNEGKRPKHE